MSLTSLYGNTFCGIPGKPGQLAAKQFSPLWPNYVSNLPKNMQRHGSFLRVFVGAKERAGVEVLRHWNSVYRRWETLSIGQKFDCHFDANNRVELKLHSLALTKKTLKLKDGLRLTIFAVSPLECKIEKVDGKSDLMIPLMPPQTSLCTSSMTLIFGLLEMKESRQPQHLYVGVILANWPNTGKPCSKQKR
jgi:hypothetical protein